MLLPPTILHRTEYPAGPPSKRLIISFWYPKDLFGMTDYYLPLLSIFNAQTPIYRFPKKYEDRCWTSLMKFILFREIMTILEHPEQRLIIHSMFIQFLYAIQQNQTKIYTQTSHPATLQHKKYTALPTISIVTMKKNCHLIHWLTNSF